MKYNPTSLVVNPMKVTFAGEDAIDEGGLSKEWMTLALKDIFDTDKGLFKLSSNGVTI